MCSTKLSFKHDLGLIGEQTCLSSLDNQTRYAAWRCHSAQLTLLKKKELKRDLVTSRLARYYISRIYFFFPWNCSMCNGDQISGLYGVQISGLYGVSIDLSDMIWMQHV